MNICFGITAIKVFSLGLLSTAKIFQLYLHDVFFGLKRTLFILLLNFLNEMSQCCRLYFIIMKLLCPRPAKCPVSLQSQQLIQSHPIRTDLKKTAANEFQGVKSTWRLKKFPTPSSVSQLGSMPSSGCHCPAGTAVVTTTRAHVTANQMKTPGPRQNP